MLGASPINYRFQLPLTRMEYCRLAYYVISLLSSSYFRGLSLEASDAFRADSYTFSTKSAYEQMRPLQLNRKEGRARLFQNTLVTS
jgi:hypothetical protein